ncbi:MAG: DinB family protein [Gemmatimonadetes bacterium]|nr:DinB family protein [Gemmatimonadota bacterium]
MSFEIGEFLWYFERVRERTLRVLACVPDHRMHWRPAAGAFSFGDLVRHLGAVERWMFAENASRRPSRYPGHQAELAEGYGGDLAYLAAMHEQAMEIFRGLTAEDLDARCVTPGGAEITVWKWLRSMVEHEVHHRGQIYLMLRMLEIETPPLYGLSSEQVRANSL